MQVLIPFKAGQWFKPTPTTYLQSMDLVLIPFKAGQWFKRFPIVTIWDTDRVLIPFKAGQWFKRCKSWRNLRYGCLNPF